MLTRARQKKWFSKVSSGALLQLQIFCITRNAEALHQFRVLIKKLDALISFVESHPQNGRLIKLFLPVHAIFKRAGFIRNFDVNRDLISPFAFVSPDFMASQLLQRDHQASIFIRSSERFSNKIEECCQAVNMHLFDVKDEFIRSRTNTFIEKIDKILKHKHNKPEALHEARKKIKMLLYVQEVLPASTAGKLKLNSGYLNRIQLIIGKWHDVQQTREVLLNTGKVPVTVLVNLENRQDAFREKLTKQVKHFSSKVISK